MSVTFLHEGLHWRLQAIWEMASTLHAELLGEKKNQSKSLHLYVWVLYKELIVKRKYG